MKGAVSMTIHITAVNGSRPHVLVKVIDGLETLATLGLSRAQVIRLIADLAKAQASLIGVAEE